MRIINGMWLTIILLQCKGRTVSNGLSTHPASTTTLDNEHTPRHNMAKMYRFPRMGGTNYILLGAQASLIRFEDRLSSGCPHARNSSTESAPTLLERDCHVGT